MEIYVVKPEDTIYSIARRFGIPAARIIADNELTDPDRLAVGQTLVILYHREVYVVKAGDTLESIAMAYSISVNQLLRNNPRLGGGYEIYPGELLVISINEEKLGTLSMNGYLYPFIDRQTLRKTLPYLTYATVFTYGFNADGELSEVDDREVVDIIREYGVAPIMLLSTLTDEGSFSNQLASELFADTAAQDRLISEILANLRLKGYYGLDIDFEYIFASDRQNYVDFVTRVRTALEPEGYPVFVSLAPKTSADQPGLLYQGHDYAGLGAAADFVLLMTYEWGYTYGPPMAVAPLNKVAEVLDYAVTEIPPDKIFMGVPNYGYDWTLPFIMGESIARSLSNVAAVKLAVDTGSEIFFDTTAQSPFFGYFENGAEHEVWFEDARSVEAKLALASDYGFRGCGCWNIMRFFPQSWLVLNALYEIRKVL